MIQSEGVADCEGRLSHAQRRRGADGYRRWLFYARVDLQDRDVLVRIESDQLGVVPPLQAAVVGDDHLGSFCRADDVIVGANVAGVVPHESGPGTGGNLHGIHRDAVSALDEGRNVHD